MIPRKIEILGIPHDVILCEDNFNQDPHLGMVEYAKCKIKINANMPEPLQKQALCHEWLHAALVLLGFNDETADEQFVQALSMAICQSFSIKGCEE